MLSIDAPVSLLVVREMLVTVLLNALIAMPFFAVMPARAQAGAAGRARTARPARLDDLVRPDRPAGARGLMYLDSDRRPPITPQLAFRVAVIGGFALVMFAIIFFRLWYLQILSGDKYLADANNNRVREIKVEAPRGEILDRDGRVLVDNRVGLAVKVRPDEIPPPGPRRSALYERLAKTLADEARRACARASRAQLKAQPFVSATVKQDVAVPGRLLPRRARATTSPASSRRRSSCASTRTTRSARTCSARSAR